MYCAMKIKTYTGGTTIKTIFEQANKWRKSRIPIVRPTSCAYLLASCPVWFIVVCSRGGGPGAGSLVEKKGK